MYQSYSLSRFMGDDAEQGTTFTVADNDAVNCAQMLAAGFNTMSRNFMNGWVLAVVNAEDGRVFYDGKTEQIKRDKPWYAEQTFTFNTTAGDADTILTLFGDGETPTFTAAGKFTATEKPKYAHIDRDVLEAAYGELEAVKNVLFDAGVETIPADAGVRALAEMNNRQATTIEHQRVENEELRKRNDFEHIARTALERTHHEQNKAARAELIEHVKRAYDKWSRVDPGRTRDELKAHLRGMIEVLSKFLVAIGEADEDERHAVAARVCDIPGGTYLYDDA